VAVEIQKKECVAEWRHWPEVKARAWYYCAEDGRAAVCAYEGDSDSPAFHGPFPTPERRDAYIADWIKLLQRTHAMNAVFALQGVK
jgi:hypothetical protein